MGMDKLEITNGLLMFAKGYSLFYKFLRPSIFEMFGFFKTYMDKRNASHANKKNEQFLENDSIVSHIEQNVLILR